MVNPGTAAKLRGTQGCDGQGSPTTSGSPGRAVGGSKAEMVRDNALAVSGLLVKTIGGASAKPYQPAGY